MFPFIYQNEYYLNAQDKHYIDGLAQERHNSNALALELPLFCTNAPIYHNRNIPLHDTDGVTTTAPCLKVQSYDKKIIHKI